MCELRSKIEIVRSKASDSNLNSFRKPMASADTHRRRIEVEKLEVVLLVFVSFFLTQSTAEWKKKPFKKDVLKWNGEAVSSNVISQYKLRR